MKRRSVCCVELRKRLLENVLLQMATAQTTVVRRIVLTGQEISFLFIEALT